MTREQKEAHIRERHAAYAWLMDQAKFERYLRRSDQSDLSYEAQKASYDEFLDLLIDLIATNKMCHACESLDAQLRDLHIQAGTGIQNDAAERLNRQMRAELSERLRQHQKEGHLDSSTGTNGE